MTTERRLSRAAQRKVAVAIRFIERAEKNLRSIGYVKDAVRDELDHLRCARVPLREYLSRSRRGESP